MGFDKIDATKKLENLEALRSKTPPKPSKDSRAKKPMVKPGKLPLVDTITQEEEPVDTITQEEEPVDTITEEEEPVDTESLAFLTQVQEDCKSKE